MVDDRTPDDILRWCIRSAVKEWESQAKLTEKTENSVRDRCFGGSDHAYQSYKSQRLIILLANIIEIAPKTKFMEGGT